MPQTGDMNEDCLGSRPTTGQARPARVLAQVLLFYFFFVENFQTHPKVVGNANENSSYTYHLASTIIAVVNVI